MNVTTQYDYTAVGDLTSITNPLGAVTSFVHDAMGRTLSETNPLGKTWGFEYDLLAVIDYATGTDTTFQYDAEQILIAMTDTIGASGWVYDDAGRMTEQTDSLGQVLGVAYDAQT